ncbi:MAG: recombination protein NinG, partial [Polaribacter sp.]
NADSKGNCTCVTCGKVGHWKTGGIQAGHFMSRKHYSTRWDERNVKPQCVGCNVFKSGEQYKYSLYLGKQLSEELMIKSKEIVKFTSIELEEMINFYSNEIKKYS